MGHDPKLHENIPLLSQATFLVSRRSSIFIAQKEVISFSSSSPSCRYVELSFTAQIGQGGSFQVLN